MMSLLLNVSQRAKAVRFLLLNWESDRIAREITYNINTKAGGFEIRPFYWRYKRGLFLANPTKTSSPHQLI
jgi:hypothetical protein